MKKKRFLSILLSLVMVMGLMTGMSVTAYADTDVTSVTLDKTTLSMVGDMNSCNETLVATVAPDNASNKTVVWTNSDESVVYYYPNSNLGDGGYDNICSLRPRKAGTAIITVRATNGTGASDDDKTATCTVKVYDPYPIGTVWHCGDPINLHGAWFISQQNDSTYLQHSKDESADLPGFTRNISDNWVATPDFLPVSAHIYNDQHYDYENDKTIPLYMLIPDGKKDDQPIGIKLVKGNGGLGTPYEFELVYKTDPAVTAPEAKTLTYNGSAQELVTAGTAEGGEMQYALGTDATTAPTSGWSTSIPAATNAGTYYVWYKVVGDENHNDTAPVALVVMISDAPAPESSITFGKTELRIKNGAPKTVKAILGNSNDSITGVKFSKKKIVKVEINGNDIIITPKKAGKTKITLTSSKGVKATINVTVEKGSSLNVGKKLTLNKGESFKIKAYAVPTSVKLKRVTSSEPKIVKVSKNGKITAKKKGKANITVELSNGKEYTIKVTVK